MNESREMQLSYYGARILGRQYDLIHIDFGREHPSAALIEMVRERPEELVARTDLEAAAFVANYVNSHLESCNSGCLDLRVTRITKEVKGY